MSHAYTAKDIIRIAVQLGFVVDGKRDGSDHYVARHPNGAIARFPSTPGEYRGFRNMIAELERKSGQKLPRANHRKSRKKDENTDFSMERANYEQYLNHQQPIMQQIDKLMEEHNALVNKFVNIATGIAECPEKRADLIKSAAKLMERLGKIEMVLTEVLPPHQPVPQFDPYNYIKI